MIAFSCQQCGKKYRLKPEFAGRKTACAGCKAALLVPASETPAPDALSFISSCLKVPVTGRSWFRKCRTFSCAVDACGGLEDGDDPSARG